MKQYEDRKKVVAAIYLNTMSTKVSNVEARERQRRRQSDSGVHTQPGKTGMADQQESGAVRTSIGGSMNRSQLYGVEKPSANARPFSKFRQDYISKRNGRSG